MQEKRKKNEVTQNDIQLEIRTQQLQNLRKEIYFIQAQKRIYKIARLGCVRMNENGLDGITVNILLLGLLIKGINKIFFEEK